MTRQVLNRKLLRYAHEQRAFTPEFSIRDCVSIAAESLRDELAERAYERADIATIEHDLDAMAAA